LLQESQTDQEPETIEVSTLRRSFKELRVCQGKSLNRRRVNSDKEISALVAQHDCISEDTIVKKQELLTENDNLVKQVQLRKVEADQLTEKIQNLTRQLQLLEVNTSSLDAPPLMTRNTDRLVHFLSYGIYFLYNLICLLPIIAVCLHRCLVYAPGLATMVCN